uniref:Uncharacterized protein n=1 Tax=Anguilla anguilla TaxID=7936 RepID=A0A0E9VIK4_ANGAN
MSLFLPLRTVCDENFFLVEFTVPGLESVCFQPRAEPFYGSWVFQKVFLFFR